MRQNMWLESFYILVRLLPVKSKFILARAQSRSGSEPWRTCIVFAVIEP
jgi:hypothetical protein